MRKIELLHIYSLQLALWLTLSNSYSSAKFGLTFSVLFFFVKLLDPSKGVSGESTVDLNTLLVLHTWFRVQGKLWDSATEAI